MCLPRKDSVRSEEFSSYRYFKMTVILIMKIILIMKTITNIYWVSTYVSNSKHCFEDILLWKTYNLRERESTVMITHYPASVTVNFWPILFHCPLSHFSSSLTPQCFAVNSRYRFILSVYISGDKNSQEVYTQMYF